MTNRLLSANVTPPLLSESVRPQRAALLPAIHVTRIPVDNRQPIVHVSGLRSSERVKRASKLQRGQEHSKRRLPHGHSKRPHVPSALLTGVNSNALRDREPKPGNGQNRHVQSRREHRLCAPRKAAVSLEVAIAVVLRSQNAVRARIAAGLATEKNTSR